MTDSAAGEARRVVVTDARRLRLETVSADPLRDREIRIRNRMSMVSPGTELALYTGTHVGFGDPEIPFARYPLYPGYASVGIVEEVGAEVSAPAVGSTVLHYQPHASHVTLDPAGSMCVPVPDRTPDRFLLVRFAQIASTALYAAHVEPQRVLVLGAGLVGNLCAQVFRREGSRVGIADLIPHRLDVAGKCGIEAPVGETDAEAQAAGVRAYLGEPDIVVEATGVPQLVTRALQLVRPGGEVILLGSSRGEVALNVYKLIHRKRTTLTGAHETLLPVHAAADEPSRERVARGLVSDIEAGRIVVEPLVSSRYAAEDIASAYGRLETRPEEELGVILEWERNR